MNLRNTIEQLRCQQASNELVINTLSHSRKWKEVLCQLRSGRSVEAIANWLDNQFSLGAGATPSLSHLSSADTNLTNRATFAGASDTLCTSEMSDESVSASTVSSMSSDCLLDSRYDMDANSQWSQSLEASQAHSNGSNSQPATDSSQPFTPKVNANDLATFWANSVPWPVAPPPASSQPAADSSQPFTPNVNANDLVTCWSNSVPLPLAPLPGSSVVAGSGDSMEDSLFWPFPMQGQPMLPTGDAFAGGAFEMV